MWILPIENRKLCKVPGGQVFRKTKQVNPETLVAQFVLQHKLGMILTVGDVTTITLIRVGLEPSVAIVDGKTRRGIHEQVVMPLAVEETVENPSGEIQDASITKINEAIKRWLSEKKRTIIRVIGEEDLLTIPAVIAAPINAAVIYGQPDVGQVLIEVSETTQQKFQEILTNNFKRVDKRKIW